MRFSIVHFPRSWNEDEDETIIQAIVEQSLEADELGFAAVFFPEHHFHGYCPPGSSPFVIGAYLAPLLKQAWLGFSVVVTPLHHPVRLVEQMNLLDHLTKGRAIFGLGSGIHAEEAIGFGNNFDYQIQNMNQEAIDIAEALWDKGIQDPPVHFETPYYKGDVLERVVPAPYRKSRPRLMGVAGREASITRAARNGWPVFAGGLGRDGWPQLWMYRKALAAANHPQEVIDHCMAWTTVTHQGLFIADTDEQAFDDMLLAMDGHERFLQRQWPFVRQAEAISNVSEQAIRNRPPANSEAYYTKFCLWGSPDTIAARIQQYADAGIGNVLLSFNNGLYEPDRIAVTRRSLDLFVREVMPRFKDIALPSNPLDIDLSGGLPATDERPAFL